MLQRGANMNLYLHLKWLFSNAFKLIFYRKQSKALLCLQEKGVAQSIFVHHTFSIKVGKPTELTGTFQICFWYFISLSMGFFIKIFKMS